MSIRMVPLLVLLCGVGQGLGRHVWYVPQVVDGENAPDDTERYFATEFTFVNLSATSSVDVTLTLTADDGGVFPRLPASGPGGGAGGSASLTLPPLGAGGVRTANGPFAIVGWARIEATGEIGVVAVLQYLVSGRDSVVTSTSLIPQPTTESFATVALVSPTRSTGVALLNPSMSDSAEVRVDLHRADGSFVESRTIVLPPQGKIAQFFNEGELFTSLGETFFGTAEVTSDLPLAVAVIGVDDTYWSVFPVLPGRVGE